MDNHPIPQDVTGFQFRLIGDMTIKQFAYLASGVVLAWISLSLPVFVLFKLPFVVFFAGFGVILAFIPIAGRPADTMIFYFFKAVFSPTKYVFSQQPGQQTAVAPSNQQEEKRLEDKKKEEKVKIENQPDATAFAQLFHTKQQEEPISPPQTIPQPIVNSDNAHGLSEKATEIAKEILVAQQEETTAHNKEEQQEAHQKVSDLESQLMEIRTQKQELEAKLLELQQQLSQKTTPVFEPSTAPAPTVTENVRKIPPNQTKSVGTPFVSDVPNLISGIVKDPRGNVLPNMLIEVKDKDGNPVRAFKTNPLGQFASATPVVNGVYTITFEDPNNKQRFDTIELTANGEVLQPLEVISIDAREDLRKELFGTMST